MSLSCFVLARVATAQPPSPSAEQPPTFEVERPIMDDWSTRLEQLEKVNQRLLEQNATLYKQNQILSERMEVLSRRCDGVKLISGPPTSPRALSGSMTPGMERSPILLGEESPIISGEESPTLVEEAPIDVHSIEKPSRFIVGEYDDELGSFVLVRPRDPKKTPFELRVDLFTQGRYSQFVRDRGTWVDSAGDTQLIRDFQSIEITRNFIQFSGYGIDPRLQYTAIIFSSTALNDTVYLGWINFHFNDAFDLRVGNWLLPGTREWYTSFRYTLGADRLMATTYFRPNISPGIWAQGEPIEGFHYVAMVANSLNRFTQGVERVGTNLAFGGTAWWEPMGEFGLGYSDLENHQTFTPRVGAGMVLSRESNQGFGDLSLSNPEDTILRLSNGTPLFRPSALGQGVLLQAVSIQSWAIDAAFKYRGIGVSGEYFFRSLNDFKSAGGSPVANSLFDHGGLLQAGAFVKPNKIELFARTSFVDGRFGTGYEAGGGVNWFPKGTREWRFTGEALWIDGSPAQNLLTGYRAGEVGMLYQAQFIVDF